MYRTGTLLFTIRASVGPAEEGGGSEGGSLNDGPQTTVISVLR